MGSSPRGRGKQLRARIPVVRSRLIPARAGKTRSAWRGGRWRRAHPRAGGENAFAAYRLIKLHGSSPRGRGKQGEESADGLHEGLIPARAGKTMYQPGIVGQTKAHPRAGGENRHLIHRERVPFGSSPRGRGKRACTRASSWCRRLIPARAGKTAHRYPATWHGRAHPRAGGENTYCDPSGGEHRGSSPRGRGKQCTPSDDAGAIGLIPARAGKTLRRPRRS